MTKSVAEERERQLLIEDYKRLGECGCEFVIGDLPSLMHMDVAEIRAVLYIRALFLLKDLEKELSKADKLPGYIEQTKEILAKYQSNE